MTIRTTHRTVTFSHPFMLADFHEQFPAGSYSIETEEELSDGVYFPTYPRGATAMQLIAKSHRGITEHVVIDPFHLESALALDSALAAMAGPFDETAANPQTPRLAT